jgi:nitronate monooxygenase
MPMPPASRPRSRLPAAMLEQLALPVIAAPMFLVSGPALVEAACRSGIIGALPAANARSSEILDEWLTGLTARAGARAGAPASGPGPSTWWRIAATPGCRRTWRCACATARRS